MVGLMMGPDMDRTRARDLSWCTLRLVMPTKSDSRGSEGSERNKSKDSPVPWPTSTHV